MGPNVLLVVLDTTRADAFEPYGAPRGASPAVADLARAGAALADVRSTACWTVPSHASMLTGLLPRAAGLIRAPGGTPAGCRPAMQAHRDRVLPEVLRRAGYRTRGISTNLWVSDRSGFDTGFDEFRVVDATRQPDMVGKSVRARAAWALDALRARSDDGAAEAGRVLRGWLREERDPRRPDFWFVNLIEAHSPYLPPRPWNDLGARERLRAAAEARRHLTLGEVWRNCVGDFTIPGEALERMRRLYAASIRQLDGWLAGVLEDVDLDETLVVVCSDHGENLGEGGLIGHAYSLDDRLTRVPFVVAGPGAPTALRSLAELPRAIAAAAGLDEHPWGDPLPAHAVAQFEGVADRDDPRVERAAREWGLDEAARERLVTPFECAADGRAKLVRWGSSRAPTAAGSPRAPAGAFELYDLEADPLELDPRPVERAAAPAHLVAALEHPAMELRAGPVAPPPPPDPGSPEELARIEDQMRTLGYL